MPARGVWDDFKRLKDDRVGPSKQQHGGRAATDVYAQWQCPYCPEIVEARRDDAIDKKSDVCKVHFWGEKPCPNRPIDDLRGKPKASVVMDAVAPPQTTTVTASRPSVVVAAVVMRDDAPRDAVRPRAVVTASVRGSSQEAAARHEEAMRLKERQLSLQAEAMAQQERQHVEAMKEQRKTRAAILRGFGLSDHSSDDEPERVVERTKRRRESIETDAKTAAYEHVATSAGLSPQRTNETPVAVGKRVVEGVARAVKSADKARSLEKELATITHAMDLPKDATVDDRVNAFNYAVTSSRDHFDAIADALGEQSSATDEERKKSAAGQVEIVKQLASGKHLKAVDKALGLSSGTVMPSHRVTTIKRLKSAKDGPSLRELEALADVMEKDSHVNRGFKMFMHGIHGVPEVKWAHNIMSPWAPDEVHKKRHDTGRYNMSR